MIFSRIFSKILRFCKDTHTEWDGTNVMLHFCFFSHVVKVCSYGLQDTLCSHHELTSSHTRDCKVWTDFGPLELVLFLKLSKDLLLCTTFLPCSNNYSVMSQRTNLKMYRRHIPGKTMQKVTSKFVHENIYFSGNISSKLWLFFPKMGCCQMKHFHSKVTRCVRICLETNSLFIPPVSIGQRFETWCTQLNV